MGYSLPGFSVHEILQTRILEWVAMPFSRGSSWPRNQTHISMSPALAGGLFTTSAPWEALWNHKKRKWKSLSRFQLWDLMDCSLPGSSVQGILQARILEWVAIRFSRGSSQPGIKPRSLAFQVDSLLSEPPGKPLKPQGYLQKQAPAHDTLGCLEKGRHH